MTRYKRIKEFAIQHQSLLTSGALVFGFIFDSLTIGSATLRSQTFVFTGYIFLAAASIFLLNFLDERGKGEGSKNSLYLWTLLTLQFTFGNLFSSFLVFYSRGVSFEASWPFLLLLFLHLIGNEIFRKHYVRLAVQISIFFLALFSFLIFFVPFVLRSISFTSFLLAGFLSLVVIFFFTRLVVFFSPATAKGSKRIVAVLVVAVYVSVNLLYATNSIPPLPLVMKKAYVYHSFERVPEGYLVTKESKPWYKELLSLRETYHKRPGEPVYVATAVYSPAELDTDIIHNWQYFDERTDEWKSVTRIRVPITGGREEGYRLYSVKSATFPGLWRVDVETENGRLVGRMKFMIEDVSTPPPLKAEYF